VTVDGSGNLVFTGGAGNADTISIRVNGSSYQISDINSAYKITTSISGSSGSGTNSVFIPISSVSGTQIQINTGDQDDSLAVDLSGGNFTKSIIFDGGTHTVYGGDSLKLTSNPSAFAVVNQFTGAHAGTITAGTNSVQYSNLTPVDM